MTTFFPCSGSDAHVLQLFTGMRKERKICLWSDAHVLQLALCRDWKMQRCWWSDADAHVLQLALFRDWRVRVQGDPSPWFLYSVDVFGSSPGILATAAVSYCLSRLRTTQLIATEYRNRGDGSPCVGHCVYLYHTGGAQTMHPKSNCHFDLCLCHSEVPWGGFPLFTPSGLCHSPLRFYFPIHLSPSREEHSRRVQ